MLKIPQQRLPLQQRVLQVKSLGSVGITDCSVQLSYVPGLEKTLGHFCGAVNCAADVQTALRNTDECGTDLTENLERIILRHLP